MRSSDRLVTKPRESVFVYILPFMWFNWNVWTCVSTWGHVIGLEDHEHIVASP